MLKVTSIFFRPQFHEHWWTAKWIKCINFLFSVMLMMLTVYIKGNLYLYPLKTSLCIFFLLNLFFKMLAQNHLLPNAFWEHTPSLMDNRTIYLMHLCPTVSGSGIALSHVQIFAIPWTTAHQASPSSTVSWSLLKLMSTETGMPSNHLFLCGTFLILPSIFPSIRIFFNESALCIRWPKYWSFSISPSKNIQAWSACCLRNSQESSLAP